MKKYNFILIIYIMFVLSWTILTEDLSLSSLGLGYILTTIILAFTGNFISDSKMPIISFAYLIKMIKYAFKTIIDIYTSTFKVIKSILKNSFELSLVEVELPSDLELVNALICNSITLTPGTISLEKKSKKANVLLLNPEKKSSKELVEEIESGYKSLSGS